MKKIYVSSLFVFIFNTISFAQTITSTLNLEGTFVQGISPVYNLIEIQNLFGDEEFAVLVIYDAQGNEIYYEPDNDANDGFSWNLDMGELPTGSYNLYIDFYDVDEALIEPATIYQPLYILSKPQWLVNGNATNVQVNGNIISFQGESTIGEYEYMISEDIKGIGGRPLNAYGKFKFNSQYDIMQYPIEPNISNEKTEIQLNILGQGPYTTFVRNIEMEGGSLDTSYQLSILAQDSLLTEKIDLKMPKIKFPVAGIFNVSVDAGLSLQGKLKSQIIVGQENGEWGFIESNGEKTGVAGILIGEAFVRGEIRIIGGIARANASIRGRGRLGVGLDYVSLPNTMLTPKVGGDFILYGQVCGRVWPFSERCRNSDNWYSASFGDTSFLKSNLNNDIFETSSVTFRDTGSLVLPNFAPQPSFATRGEMLYTVWMEQDEETGYILFSKLNTDGTAFSEQKIVYNDKYSISNPKVGILPNGDALITWTQARYNSLNIPLDADMNDLVQSQDIWFAFYNNTTNEISQAYRMPDDESSFQSGRAEGEANICVGDGNEALVTWVATDLINQTSDIWYSHLTETSGEWFMTNPEKLDDLSGANFNVEVVSTGGNSAIAIWMNDPDSDEDSLTYNSNILFAEWDGTSWSNTSILSTNDGSTKLKELSIASNDGYVAFAWTSTQFFADNDFDNRIDMLVYDEITNQWVDNLSDIDQNYELQKPNVSISNTGKATVTYQAVNMFADTNFISNGALNIYVKDLNANTQWQQIGDNSNICDTNAFVWELTTGYSAGDRFYVLTQEYTDNGIVTNPVNGVQFGDPELSLVIRGVQINPNLTVSDIEEPGVLPVGIVEKLANPTFKFLNFYPNPFSENTTIEFHLYQNANVQLEIFDFMGNKVTELVNKNLSTGIYKTIFNAGNLPNGIYVSKLTVDGKTAFGKLVLTR